MNWTLEDVRRWYADVLLPGSGLPADATELALAPDGRHLAFTATMYDDLEEAPGSAVVLLDVSDRSVEQLRQGRDDRAPAWGSDGTLAWLSSSSTGGGQRLWMRVGSAVEAVAEINGAVDCFRWSPDASRIALLVAAADADRPSVLGSGPVSAVDADPDRPAWMPHVDTGLAIGRRLMVVDVRTGSSRLVDHSPADIWQVEWVDDTTLVVTASDRAGEDGWYDATVRLVNLDGDDWSTLHVPSRQVWLLTVAPDGRCVAAIDGLASDRAVVMGDLVVLDVSNGNRHIVATNGTDVSHACWRDASTVVWAGLRDVATVIGETAVETSMVVERWCSDDTCGGPVYPMAWPFGRDDVMFAREGTRTPPRIVLTSAPDVPLWESDNQGSERLGAHVAEDVTVRWRSTDGTAMSGVLTLPPGDGPFPLLVNIHGGPVGAARRTWVMRDRLLAHGLARGFAVFRPNIRGSSGWGHEFRELILGEFGRGDVVDVLAGVDAAVAAGPIDPTRIAVAGASYGGYLTYMLVTHDDRFGAAVAVAPVADYFTAAYTCNIPRFIEIFLGKPPAERADVYERASPLCFADRVTTPVMTIVGARDRCSPPSQGSMFHGALVHHGRAESICLSYPEEAHGVRALRAATDVHTRVFDFIERHLLRPDAHA